MVRTLALIGGLLAISALPAAGRAAAQQADATASFRLIGTVGSKGFSGAVLVDAAGAQTFFRLHDTAPDGSQLVAVGSDSISLKRPDGTRYELFIIHDTIAASSSRSAAYPVPAAPSAPDAQSSEVHRPVPMERGPGPGAAREEAKEQHRNRAGKNDADQGAGMDQQNNPPGPGGSASGADQTQRPHPRGRKPPPGAAVSQ